MGAFPAKLHLGTSSFSSADWVGPFYPEGTRPADMLPFYATRFDTVEIDSTYYRAPSRSMAERWASVTPPGFTFALKVPKSITHDAALAGVEQEWASLLKSVEPLGPKLGFLVLQFPYFNLKSAIPSQSVFLERLGAFLSTAAAAPCPLVVETRNPKWLGKELLDFLRARKLILALQDQQWMPRPRALWEKWGDALRTGDAVYIRLLGERDRIEAMTKTWEKIVIDRTEETREWLPIVQAFLDRDIPVHLFFNNHYGGHAPASTELFKRLLLGAETG